ncbi:MAG TPA: hypothetical protein VGT40_09535 [Methylomirabilota bacterium]|nr:hypothetical protein [Methylomirabilota bacterium]
MSRVEPPAVQDNVVGQRSRTRWIPESWGKAGTFWTLWMLVATIVLPFGWIVPIARLAWVRATARRN